MADLPTRARYFEIGVTEAAARAVARPPGQRISPTEIRTEGSDANIVVASSSAMADEVTRQLAIRLAALFLDGAKGSDLDRLVADRWSPDIVRKAATPALVTLALSRTGGALAAIVVPTGTRVRTTAGVEFETTATATFGVGLTGPVSVAAQARIAGVNGNVDANTIRSFVGAPPDEAMVVTNPEAAAGGDATETDARLRARARDFYRTARRGVKSAIEFGALAVPGVRQATAIEDVDSLGNATGLVQLVIADARGQANAALVALVRQSLLEFRALGVFVDVFAGTPVFTAIRYRLRFESNVDTTKAFDLVRSATLARVLALPPRATLPVSLLFEAARSVPGVIVLDDAVLEPVGDVIPSGSQVIRTSLDLITAE